MNDWKIIVLVSLLAFLAGSALRYLENRQERKG